MYAIRSVKPKETYNHYFVDLFNYILPPQDAKATSLHFVMDVYKPNSAKEGIRRKRGEDGNRVHVSGFEQKMPRGNKRIEFLSNGQNKTDLILLFAKFLKSDRGVRIMGNLPVIVTEEENTWHIDKGEITNIFKCNHEEADTRVILHASLSSDNIIVVASDTDVLVLMVNAFAKLQPTKGWQIRVFFLRNHSTHPKQIRNDDLYPSSTTSWINRV